MNVSPVRDTQALTVLVVEEEGAGVVWNMSFGPLVKPGWAAHPPSPSEQQVHSNVSLRRAVNSCNGVATSGVCSNRPSRVGKQHDAQAACEHWRWRVRRSPCPSSPTAHPPYVPRPSALDHLDRDMLNPTSEPALALPPSCVWCPVCTSGALRAERGWVAAVNGVLQTGGFGCTTVRAWIDGQAAV
jgi:hypothetical protein